MNVNLILNVFIIIFLISFPLHVIIWRLFNPKNTLMWLLLLFILLPSIIYVVAMFFPLLNMEVDIDIFIYHLLLSGFLGGSYILSYPAIHAWSPSLYLIILLRNKKYFALEELKSEIMPKLNIEGRVLDMLNDKFVNLKKTDKTDKENCIVELSCLGKIIAISFISFRKFLGLEVRRK
ncbi:MAG: hypothetical protein HQK49_14100 [Oligoflexia bacterium]|nr:hypothetical protein [Oligoflexia bacterium]